MSVAHGSNRKGGPVPLGQLIGKLLDPVTARRGFATSELLAAWPDIVGPRYAECTRPDRITWPRRPAEKAEGEGKRPGKAADAGGGTLVVQIEGARALLFQHEVDQVRERVNAFLGFAAITRIRIVQLRVEAIRREAPAVPKGLGPEAENRLSAMLSPVDDPTLREKLDRLGREVLARSDKKS